jgi:hypothetical protein
MLSSDRLVPAVTFGSVGIGVSVDEARKNATDDWTAFVADSYCAALAAMPGGITQGSFTVYPSKSGVRGTRLGGWLADHEHVSRRILAAIPSALLPVQDEGIGLIDLKVGGGAPAQAECRVNGTSNAAVCRELLTLPWPPGAYIYTQVFVYRTNAGS